MVVGHVDGKTHESNKNQKASNNQIMIKIFMGVTIRQKRVQKSRLNIFTLGLSQTEK